MELVKIPKPEKCEQKKSGKRNNNRNNGAKASKKVAYRKVAKTSTKPSAKQRARAKLMRNELMELEWSPVRLIRKNRLLRKHLLKKLKQTT